MSEAIIEPVPSFEVHDLGFALDYKLVWDFQKRLQSERAMNRIGDTLILVEHDHVITLGRASQTGNVLVKDLPLFEIERGGDVTYHGPGQLVAYPIVSLSRRGLGVRGLVELLESVVIDTLDDFGITSAEGLLGKDTGVWVDARKRKIASIGISVSHWVSMHGVALNVNTDLSYFQKIRPCGFDSSIMTSMSHELGGEKVPMEKVKLTFLDSFERHLGNRNLSEKS